MGLRRMITVPLLRVTRRAALACACACLALWASGCTTGLVDLMAYQVITNERSALYLGYNEDGYGVARLSIATGALQVFRSTVSENNTNGCPLTIDPRPITDEHLWPWVYYTAKVPERIMGIDYLGLGDPEGKETNGITYVCLRAPVCGPDLNIFATNGNSLQSRGTYPISLTTQYIQSFDMEPGPLDLQGYPFYYRVYILGIRLAVGQLPPGADEWDDEIRIFAINSDDTNERALWQLGKIVDTNLLLQNGYLYWVDQSPPGILRLKADGSELQPTTILTPTREPHAVAVDPEAGTIYWYERDAAGSPRIMKAEPGQTAGTVLLVTKKQIDPNGFLFYRW